MMYNNQQYNAIPPVNYHQQLQHNDYNNNYNNNHQDYQQMQQQKYQQQ